jgi:hypothetical protein
MNTIGIAVAIIICALGAVAFIFGFKQFRKYSLIKDTPRSKIRSMAMGLVEIHGNVEAKQTILTPFSQLPCVYYSYRIEEYRRHTRRDSEGRTRTTYSWDTIATGSRRIPFHARDETGEVYVSPDGAEYKVPLKRMFYQRRGIFGAIGVIINALADWDNARSSRMDIGGWGLEPIQPGQIVWTASVGDRKYYEHFMEPNENLFLMGTAANDSSVPDNVLIRKGENEPTFIISNKTEDEVMGSFKWQMWGLLILAGLLEVIGVVVAVYSAGVIE